jgi:DNA polymerase
MRWSDRQQAVLQAMGLRLWAPGEPAPLAEPLPPAVAVAPEVVVAAAVPVAAPTAAQPLAPAPARPQAAPTAVRPLPAAQPLADTAVARMDWATLADTVAGCQACGLCQSRRQTVFGTGHRQAHCMVVGEAPGEQEDQRGEPFVGAAGQLLDRMLLALGLARGPADGAPQQAADAARQVYIANTLKCRPPGNRNPAPDELARCVPYLERQVALVQPRVILAMGRFAVQALLQTSEPLGKLRGQVHQWQGVPLVVTYHPAYLLRQPADKARAWADLCLAAQVLAEAAPH